MFPRIKTFNFDIKTSRTVTSEFEGRLDLIALDIYGDIRYYKPLAAANGIRNPFGARAGIRTFKEAIIKDNNNISSNIEDILDEYDISLSTWYNYGDFNRGYYTEVYSGRVLLIPTDHSALLWLKQFEEISGNR